MERARGTDETCSKVLINELVQSCKFLLGQVNGTIGQEVPLSRVILRVDGQLICKPWFAEYVYNVMIVFGNCTHVVLHSVTPLS